MSKKITYWGPKKEVALSIGNILVNFKYSETKIMDIPKGISLPSHFQVEDISEEVKPKIEANIVKPRTKKGVK